MATLFTASRQTLVCPWVGFHSIGIVPRSGYCFPDSIGARSVAIEGHGQNTGLKIECDILNTLYVAEIPPKLLPTSFTLGTGTDVDSIRLGKSTLGKE